MNVERLQRLSKLLREDAVKPDGITFNLAYWGRRADRQGLPTHNVPLSCGTSACAMGLAMLSGEFKADGLDYDVVSPTSWGNQMRPVFTDANGKEHYDFQAAMALFDIRHTTAIILFDPFSYRRVTGAQVENAVADRIDRLIASGDEQNWSAADDQST